jgi:hypothetical protein
MLQPSGQAELQGIVQNIPPLPGKSKQSSDAHWESEVQEAPKDSRPPSSGGAASNELSPGPPPSPQP